MKKTFGIILLISTLVTTSLFAYGTANTKDLSKDQTVDIVEQEEVKYLKKLSLEQAIEEGLKNSTLIKIADLNIKVKEVEISEAKSQERSYRRSNYSLGTVEGFQLDAQLFSKAAEFALEEELIKKEYDIEDMKHKITSAYYGVLQTEDLVSISESSLENIERNKDIVDSKFDLGLASRSDVLMAEIALNEAKTNLEKAKEDKQKAYRGFNMLLNYPLNLKVQLTSNFKQEDFVSNLEEDIENSYKNRFEMIKVENDYELAKIGFETSAKKYTPNTYVYRKQESTLAMAESLLKDSKQNAEFDIRNKYDAIKSAKIQIELSKANVDKAKEGLRLVEKTYDVGMATIQDVKESIVQLYNAELALSNAISNYNLSILEYNQAVELGTIR